MKKKELYIAPHSKVVLLGGTDALAEDVWLGSGEPVDEWDAREDTGIMDDAWDESGTNWGDGNSGLWEETW